ncbi:tripartite tricarboxylate transporter TctB family protein [Pseudoroseicyclus sp. CXY001]|uniref:tripartite tricarboxylate transporter TctB family protein n=1 Tax=Pseudoroseicyclus sp. CXY001 TaxID=3242492 RepID=UPI00358DC9E4
MANNPPDPERAVVLPTASGPDRPVTGGADEPPRSGLITLDRIVGVLVTCAGIWLLVYGIPQNVDHQGYESPSPRLFPQIGAWIFVIFGILQVLFVRTGTNLPALRDFLRFLLVGALLLGMVWLMETFGFLVGAMALLAALMFVVFETRKLWIAIAVFAVPVCVWVLFEIVLQRPLP